MKKIFLTLSIFSLIASCSDDFVDIKQEGVTVGTDFFKTEDDAMRATNAIYSFLRSWENSGFPAQFVFGVTGDDVEKGSNPGDASFINAYDNFSFTISDDGVNGYWTGQWQAVQRTNQVITNVPNIDMDANLKNRLIAEAKMLRAYFYFNLVRIYGGVPIFDGLKSQTDYLNTPRNTAAEVYAFIVKDLTEASEVLPQSYGAADVGRVTKGGALGLLSKVYLYMKDYQKAYDTSNLVIGMGYALEPDFNKLFRPAGEFGSESVFEVNCGCSPEFGGSQYAEVQGVRNQFGWGFFTPTQALEDAFEPGDVRKEFTILREGETTLEGDLIKKGDPQAGNTWNQKVYVPTSLNNNACGYGSIQNIRILRFADILLINAEAANELGNTGVAITNINKVRERAKLGITPASTQTALRLAIWQERRVELAMEMDRFPDLVRTGQAAQYLGPLGFETGKNELFPIPLRAITDGKGILTQNPGYN